MNHSPHTIPDTLTRATDWRERAVCKTNPDAMHPDNNEVGIAYAKQFCAACPVSMACLQDALRVDDNQWGIRGGLKPEERRAVAKRLTEDQYSDPEAVADAINHVLHPATVERTLRDLWDERTYILPGGHLGWRGHNGALSFRGKTYTPKQIAFILDRGHEPVGILRRTPACPVVECVHPRHIADNRERHQQAAAKEASPK